MSGETGNRFEGYFLLATASVVGVSHHDWSQRMHQFLPGVPVKIQYETGNVHDQWAVRVVARPEGEKASKVGYLPAGQKVLHLMLKNGYEFLVEPREDPSRVSPQVDIWMKKCAGSAGSGQKVSE